MLTLPDGCYRVNNSEGLVWVKKPNGSWLLPTDLGFSDVVGWAHVEFAERWLLNQGAPIEFTAEQTRQILWMRAVNPDTLSFVFPTTAITRVKGVGKDFIAATGCLFELVGDCRPAIVGGEMVAVPQSEPHVVVLATSLEQTSNTSSYIRGMLSEDAVKKFGIDLGKIVTYAANGGKLESVTSNAIRLEGTRPTHLSATEIGLWLPSNGGIDLWGSVERSAAKIPNTLVVASSNAYAHGQRSVLESLHEDYQRQQGGQSHQALLVNYDSLSAPADTNVSDPESLKIGIEAAVGDAYWVDTDRMFELAMSSRTRVENTLRFSLNIPASPDEAVFDALQWDACRIDGLTLKKGDRVTLGLDVSLSDDASVLVAMRTSDRAAFVLEAAEKPLKAEEGWRVDVSVFSEALARAYKDYKVMGFFSDVNPIQGYVEKWEREYGDKTPVRFDSNHKVAADMRASQRRFTLAFESVVAAVETRSLKHNGDPLLRRHALNAHRRYNRHGLSFGKAHRGSHHKVDALAALLLADMARAAYLDTAGSEKKVYRSSFSSW